MALALAGLTGPGGPLAKGDATSGVERIGQVKFAVLDVSGKISIAPKAGAGSGG